MNYQSFDIIQHDQDNPKKIKRIIGRAEDYIICKDGTRITRVGFIFKDVNNVKYAQIISESKGKITINVVPDNKFSDNDKLSILNNTYKRLGKHNIDLEFNLINESQLIKTGPNMKFKFIINKFQE